MIEIDIKRCNACGFCEGVCPNGAITVDRECARIDANLCTECGACIEACSRNAIQERVPEEAATAASTGMTDKGREAKDMYGRGMICFGRGLGRGFGCGMGLGYGRGMGFGGGFGRRPGFGRGYGRGMGHGFGRGNSYPYGYRDR